MKKHALAAMAAMMLLAPLPALAQDYPAAIVGTDTIPTLGDSLQVTTTLSTAITAGATVTFTVDVVSTTGWPAAGFFVIGASGDLEVMRYDSLTATSFNVVERSVGTPAAVAHDVGDQVFLGPVAFLLSNMGAEIIAIETELGVDPAGGSATVVLRLAGWDAGVLTGVVDGGGATSFEVPNGAAPTVNATGEVALDTSVADFSTDVLLLYGSEEQGVVSMPIAQFGTPTDGHVVSYNATNDEFELVASGAGAPADATYITQTANGTLSAEQALSALSTGIMRVATTTGVVTALTDSAGIAANISDETGSAALVFADNPALTGTPTFGDGATAAGGFNILEDTDDGANFTRFQVVAMAANITYSLPPDDGDAGEQLQTDGAGVLTWEVAGGGGGATISAGDSDVTVTDAGTGQIDITLDGAANVWVIDSNGILAPDGTATAGAMAWQWSDDTDTGFYSRATGHITFKSNNTVVAEVRPEGIGGGQDRGMLLAEIASATNPNIIPKLADLNTGIGLAADDQLSLIAGAIEGLRLTELSSGVVLQYETSATLTASTTQTQGQEPLVSTINEVSVVANANDTVTLPSALAGSCVRIINNGANTLRIFPASGDDAGAGVDTQVTLASGSNVHYCAYDATTWETF